MAMQSGENLTQPNDFRPPRTWAELDANALRHNAAFAKSRVSPAGILPVIKADAYGHGALFAAQALSGLAESFAVANLAEALHLKQAGIDKDILLLSPCFPEEVAPAVEEGFVLTVSSAREALACVSDTPGAPKPRLHFKIDTGMGRLGHWREQGEKELISLAAEERVEIRMISSHLSAADEDSHFTCQQLEWFSGLVYRTHPSFPQAGFHILNSAGILRHPQFAFDLVRPGLLLYGESPVRGFQNLLRPVLNWKTRVVGIKEVDPGRRISYGGDFVTERHSRIGILPLGYADGYFRQIPSGTARVLVEGHSCPVVGRVTMDLILVDLTEAPEAREGSEVVLLGADGNGGTISATEFSSWAQTIPWDVFTSIGKRVPRIDKSIPAA